MSIKDYWIEELQNVREFHTLSDVLDIEVDAIKEEIIEMIDNQFIDSATEKGIARREKMLNIQPFADDTLDTRRFRISNRWQAQLPYTHNKLIDKLNSLVGKDGYTINLTHSDYILNIKINLGQKRMKSDIDSMVRITAPANLLISVELQYNRHIDLSLYTHEKLSLKTHKQLKEEVLY